MANKTAAEYALAQEGARLAWIKARMESAVDRGDAAEVDRLADLLDKAADGIEVRVGRAVKEANMSKEHEANYEKAVSQLTNGVITAAAELRKLDAEREKYPAAWYSVERARIVQFIRGSDGAARDALAVYHRQAMDEASALRATAEADRDPTERLADLTERRALAESGTNAEVFAGRAQAMLAAGRPGRAALMLAVAEDKGWRGGVGVDPKTGAFSEADRLRRGIEESLDREDPTRALARALEDSVEENIVKFQDLRLRSLTASGLGVTESGEVGTGAAAVAIANSARKLGAYLSGGDFSDASTPPEGGDA